MAKFTLQFNDKALTNLLPDELLKSSGAWKITAICCRYLETEELPRIGDYILYPFFDLVPELKWWMHYNICFKVESIIHNPIRVFSISDNPPIEREEEGAINTIIRVTPELFDNRK